MSLDFYLQAEVDTGGDAPFTVEIDSWNFTHNLNRMAHEAGIYECLWRPNEHGYETAGDVAPVLSKGIADMEQDPERFKALDAENGWGTYEQWMPILQEMVKVIKRHPKAKIRAWG